MMGEAQAPGGLGKARTLAGHHDLSAPALLGPACSTPSPRGRVQHGGPGYLSCILRAKRMGLAIL